MRCRGLPTRSSAANGAAASSTMTATGRHRRHRALAEARRGRRARSRLVQSTEGILPGTRFAVEAYVNFVRDRPLLEGMASSLTEMFSPDIIADRCAACWRAILHHRGDAGLFHAAADPGAAGREFALSTSRRSADPRPAGSGAGGAALQVRRAVGAARCAASRLCRAGPDPAGRLRAEVSHGAPRRLRTQRAAPRADIVFRFDNTRQPGSCWRPSG